MADRPNIVFLFPDQLRRDFLSCYGADFIATPNIDSIAENGTRYDQAYSQSPICVPARNALLSGMNAIRNGITDNNHGIRLDYQAAGIQTWPQLMSDAGYYTSAIGKMHFYPWDARFGFQHRVICEDKRWLNVRDDYFHYLRERGLRKLHGNEHAGYFENQGAIVHQLPWEHSWDRFVGREAVNFLEQYGSDGPFAMMVGFPGPHCPYDPAEDFEDAWNFDPNDMPAPSPDAGDTPKLRQGNIDVNKNDWNGVDIANFTDAQKRKVRAHYAGLVKQVDHEVGEVLDALRRNGLLDNTVVILATDHGDYLGDHGLIGKASFYEAAIHIPMVIQGPGLPVGQVSNDLVEVRDITATMLSAAGVGIPQHMDSRPLPGLRLTDEPARERIYGMLSDGWMIFDGEWRLSRYSTGEVTFYNLHNDPQEQVNLADHPSHRELRDRLSTELDQEIMRSVRMSMHDRLADLGGMAMQLEFGYEGRSRPYPFPVTDVTA